MADKRPPLRIRRSSTPGFRPGDNGTPPLAPDEMFVQMADGLLIFYQDEGTNAIMSMNIAPNMLSLADAVPPYSTDDPAGEFGDVLFSGDTLYRKTLVGWFRLKGERF